MAVGLVEFMLKLEMSLNVTPWYARVPTPSNPADDPSRGDVDDLVSRGVVAVCPDEHLDDILTVLSELPDMKGSANYNGKA